MRPLPPRIRNALPIRVAAPIAYVVIGIAWILGGDLLLAAMLGGDDRTLAWAASSKAGVFIVLSAVALYALLRKIGRARGSARPASAVVTISLLLATTTLVMLAGYGLFRVHADATLHDWQAELNGRADTEAQHVDDWLREQLAVVQLIAGSELLERELGAWRAAPDADRAAAVLGRIDDLRALNERRIVSVVLLSSDGRVLFFTGDLGATGSDGALAAAALSARRPLYGAPYVGHGQAGRPLIAVAAPLGEQDLAPATVAIVATFDMHDALDPVQEADGEGRRRSVETLLAYRGGGQIALLSGRRGATWETLDYQAGDGGIAGLIATGRDHALDETLDRRGIEVLATARRVLGTDWYVIVKADRSEIYRTTLQLAQLGLAVLVLLVLALVVSIGMIRRRAQEDVQARTADAELRIGALTEHFELASRHANDIILLVGPDGLVVQANERAVETYGYSRKELIGLAVTALQPEGMNDDGPTVRRFGDTGTLALIFETVHRRKDGSTIPVEVSARRFEIGNQKYSQAIVRNISERKAREAEMLRLAAERDLMAAQLRLQFDGMPFACVITDVDLRVVDANPAFERLFGWTAGQLAGLDNLDRIVDPTDLPGVRKVFKSLRSGPGPLVNVNRNRTRDGRVITCRWTNTALRTANGDFAGLLAVCEDLTTELELKHEVEAGEATFEALARTTPVGVFQLGPDGVISYANPMLIDMLGLGTENLRNAARGLFLLPEDRPRAARLLREVLDGAVLTPQEFRFTGKNGTSGWLLAHAHPVPDGDGKVQRVVGTATDITRLKQQEDMLEKQVAERTVEYRAAKEMAERASAVKTEFLASVSHDLRTPLNSIVGFTDVLLEQTSGALNERQQRQLTIVRDAARRLRTLISDLLDISRIETGRLNLELGPVAIGDLVRRSADGFGLDARARGLALVIDASDVAVDVVTDATRVEQILGNLLSNAIKYTVSGSVSVRAGVINDEVVISVTDTGIGIRGEEQERIFDPFVQLPREPGQPRQGVGLGLAISRKLADALGGSIEVESTIGLGSTFRLRLPARGQLAA